MCICDVEEKQKLHKEPTCLVVGDAMLDRYLYGSVSRISPEAPIPIVSIREETAMLGGSANVAANLRGLGLEVVLCGVIGDDYEGNMLCKLMKQKGIIFQGLQSGRRTTIKTRIIGQAQQIVRIDKEDAEELNGDEEQNLLQGILPWVEKADCVILSDYKKGVCTERICQSVIEEAHRLGKKVFVDPKQADWHRYRNADLIKPNFGEFCAVVGKKLKNSETDILEAATVVLQRYGLAALLVTRSQYGMSLIEAEGKAESFEAVQKEVYDVSGAGDTALAALAAGWCWGYGLKEAVRLSNVAAGIVVGKIGTCTVGKRELLEGCQRAAERDSALSAVEMSELSGKLLEWRRQKKKIVFTNGCFDILHRGHVDCLQKAKALGDILIVGVNSDASVKRLKGDSRPINTVQDRAYLLKAMDCVDEVVVFEEDTPYELIQAVQPDILVKGGDYRAEEVVGREFAGEVRILPFVEGYSTSEIIHNSKA